MATVDADTTLGLRARWRWPALPSRCLLCRQWSSQPLCLPCQQRFAPPLPRCQQCGLYLPGTTTPAAPAHSCCGACLLRPPPYVRTLVLADYAFPWDRLIARLKFEQQPALAPVLAELLLPRLQAALAQPDGPRAERVLPVPLSPQRLAERGYNQAWLIARHLARRLGLPAEPQLLERWQDSPHQVGATRAQRQANLQGAMAVDTARCAQLRGRHLALVDDVMTTGVTAQVATQALLTAGAASVQVWVLARTPAHAHTQDLS